jgi:hypothetical protein
LCWGSTIAPKSNNHALVDVENGFMVVFNGARIGTVEIDPILYGVNFGIRF